VIGAIILAAGASRRMGFPKPDLPYRNSTFLGATAQACEAAGLKPVVVVVSPETHNALAIGHLPNLLVVENETPHTGQLGSLKKGLRAVLNRPVEGVVVWPVDQPHVRVDTVQQLIETYRRSPRGIVVPTYDGRRGHPVLFGRAVFDELLATPEDLGARAVVRADPSRVVEVAVPDRAVLEDIDTPEAYERLLKDSPPPPIEP